jgi:hypothetical protein
MRIPYAFFALFVFAAIVSTAPDAFAKPSCGCRQNSPVAGEDIGGGLSVVKPGAGAAAPRQAGATGAASRAKEAPARHILEIELNVFGRRYNFELITTLPSAALTPERNSPAVPAVPAAESAALG